MTLKRYIVMGCAILALGACDKTREQFRMTKEAPDEFAVIKRAPLEMPSDFAALPAPQPGAARPQEQSAVQQARASILGNAASQAPQNATQSEIILLQKAGAQTVPAHIRKQVDEETAKIAKDETPTFDRIMGLTGRKVTVPAVEVDPVAETNRIKANRAAGKPPTEGDTAVRKD